ncbi:MAG: hypothetical protein HY268_28215 [Deltaproteobacteria bacterium]|nr:hypothetical protein [Deltaproteobacteria bacterium]
MNDSNGPKGRKGKLLEEIQYTKQATDRYRAKGQEIVEQGQIMKDLAESAEAYVASLPDDTYVLPERWDQGIAAWNAAKSRLDTANEILMTAGNVYFTTAATGVTTSWLMSSMTLEKPLPLDVQPIAEKAVAKFNKAAERANWGEEAEKELFRMGFDNAPVGQNSAALLLRQARDPFLRPSADETAPAAVLIPLRESINRVLADLLRRRPNQEPAKGADDKVMSIGSQVARSGIQQGDLVRLATDARDLINALSASKQGEMTREDVRLLFMRGASFLVAFLRALDESKLKT